MFNDHQIMCEDSQQALAFLGGVVTGPQRRVQPAFVSGDHALHLPTIPVDSIEESPFHLAAVLCFGPTPSGVTPVERNDRTAYAQLLPAQPMIGLAVVARQAGGINRTLGLGGDQAAFAGAVDNGPEQFMESPFFRRRRSA